MDMSQAVARILDEAVSGKSDLSRSRKDEVMWRSERLWGEEELGKNVQVSAKKEADLKNIA